MRSGAIVESAWSMSFLLALVVALASTTSSSKMMALASDPDPVVDEKATATATTENIAENATEEEEDLPTDFPDCGLYLAVSSTSTPEEPKWGLYAGHTIEKDARVGYGEVAIQTFHLLANQLTEKDEADGASENQLADIVDFFEQYIWVPHSSGGQFELPDSGRTVTAIPGVGVLGGFNARMTNADWNHWGAYHREAWGEETGASHPGRGGSSTFFEVALSAQDKIPAGMEIFINYGVNWEADNEDDDDKNAEIEKEDYDKIDQMIDKMLEFFEKHEAELDPHSKQEIYKFLIQDVLMASAGTKKGKNIAKFLPESPDGLKGLKEKGGALHLVRPETVRSLPWLAKHGRCSDNIRPGPSNIPHAGRGALATRALAAGTIIAPLPLIQIANGEILNMYPLEVRKDEEDDEYFIRKRDAESNGKQLLLNYCLGHPESKMLFFPTGSATNFINHSPEPNAKLVWSDHPNNHKHWFDLKPKTLIEEGNQHLGLLMEVVALKDIAEGEEVTIDYGPEWAAAWAEHVAKWEASVKEGTIGTVWPTRALDYNNQFISKSFPLADETFPENLMMKCFLMVKKPTDEPPINEAGEKIRHWTKAPKTFLSENLFDCTLTDREEVTPLDGDADGAATSWNYTVKWSGKTEVTWVKHVPHKAIVFVDKPGTSDQHIGQAFRHYIAIPDEIFPQGPWRNINNDEEEDVVESDDDDDDDGENEDDDDDEGDDDDDDEED